MTRNRRLRCAIAIGMALALGTGLGACTRTPEQTLRREGPAPSWSLQIEGEGRLRSIAVIGEVVVVPDHRALLGVSRSAGKVLWRRDTPEGYSFTVASGQVVIQKAKDGPLEVIDPRTGTTRWRAAKAAWGFTTNDKAIYTGGCTHPDGARPTGCTTTARAVRDGRTLWTAPGRWGKVSDEVIGARAPRAPAGGPLLATGLTGRDGSWAALAADTGRVVTGRAGLPAGGWYRFMAGATLVVTDHDPPSGDQRCTVRVHSVDTRTRRTWSGAVFSGQRADGGCVKRLALSGDDGQLLIGTGSRIAAVTAHGTPQVFDLAAGHTTWAASAPGVPIDGDARSLLVRRSADQGGLTLLDFTTGTARWSAPDPGLSGQSASWASTVTRRLVAVSGASGERPLVLVYDVHSGRQLGRFPSWLHGAGDDWVAVTHGAGGDRLILDFVRL